MCQRFGQAFAKGEQKGRAVAGAHLVRGVDLAGALDGEFRADLGDHAVLHGDCTQNTSRSGTDAGSSSWSAKDGQKVQVGRLTVAGEGGSQGAIDDGAVANHDVRHLERLLRL